MKTFTRILAVTAVALGVALPAIQAEGDAATTGGSTTTTSPAKPPRPRATEFRAQRMQQLDEKLHLSAEQKSAIEAIWAKTGEQTRALREQERSVLRENRKQQRQALQASRQQVRALLTPEQQKIFDEMPRPAPRQHALRSGDGEAGSLQ